MNKTQAKANFQYSATQAFYWMAFCSIVNFSSNFLSEMGYSVRAVGWILALGYFFSVFVQQIIASISDKSKRFKTPHMILVCVAIQTILALALLVAKATSIAMSVIYVALITLINSTQPLCNAIPNYLGHTTGARVNFGIGRAMGSLFFSFVSVVMGRLITGFGIKSNVFVITTMSVLFAVNTLWIIVSTSGKQTEADHANVGKSSLKDYGAIINKNRWFLFILLGIVGFMFGHSIINNFLYQIMTNAGGDSASLGVMLALCAALELPTMIFYKQLEDKFGVKKLFILVGISFTLKCLFTALSTNVYALYATSFLQMLAFAIYVPASVSLVEKIMDKSEVVRGHALVTGAYTIGCLIACLSGGVIIDNLGVVASLYVSTGLAFVGLLSLVAGFVVSRKNKVMI